MKFLNKKNITNKNISSISLILKLWKLLKSKRKKQLIGLLLIMSISGISEIISIASFIPFINSLLDSNVLFDNKYINFLSTTFNLYSQNSLIFLTTFIFILFVMISTMIRLLNIWLNSRMTAIIGSDISIKAFKGIIYQPYIFSTSKNSSELISILNTQLDFTVAAISLILRIITNLTILFIIGFGLLFLDFQLAIFSGFFIITPYLLITIYTKKRVYKNSSVINYSLINKVKTIQDSLNMNKEIIINELHNNFIKRYKSNEILLREKLTENNFLSMFPRYTMEGIGITSIAILAAIFTNIRSSGENLIPFLGALTLAAQRLVPTLQQIYAGFANIRGYSSAINSVINTCYLEIPNNYLTNNKQKFVFQKNLYLKNISFSFGKNEDKKILENINLEILKGDKIGIIGATGSGKSTLVNLISGFITPKTGSIILDNKFIIYDSKENNLRSWYHLISHVPQQIYLKDGTIWENISLANQMQNVDQKKLFWAAEKAEILEYIKNSKLGFNTIVGEKGIKLSGGQCQRISIARALYKNCDVLLLDESTSSLDVETEKLVINNLMNLDNNMTIIFIAHRLSTLSKCSKIIEIKNGKIDNIHTPKSLGIDK